MAILRLICGYLKKFVEIKLKDEFILVQKVLQSMHMCGLQKVHGKYIIKKLFNIQSFSIFHELCGSHCCILLFMEQILSLNYIPEPKT